MGKGLVWAALLLVLTSWAQQVIAQTEGEQGFWQVQTSVYTRHFSPDPQHNNHQKLIGLEWDDASGWLFGGATFRNSYDQQSVYGYAGKRFESADYPVYLKVSGGLLVTAPLTPHPTPTAEAEARTVFRHHQPSHPPYRDLLLMT